MKSFTHQGLQTFSSNVPKYPLQGGITTTVPQLRKPKAREGKSPAQGHTAGEWQSSDPHVTVSQKLIQADHKTGVYRVRSPALALGSHLELAGPRLPRYSCSSEGHKARVVLHARLCPALPLLCPGADQEGFQSANPPKEWRKQCAEQGQFSGLRQVTLPGSGLRAPGWGRRSRCGGGRWDPLGCVALTGSQSDEPDGRWSGGETQGAGDRRHRCEAGVRGTPARSWRGRCPGALCLRCAPRTSSRSPCGSGRCAPPGGVEGHERLQGPPGHHDPRGPWGLSPVDLAPCTERAISEQVSRKSHHEAVVVGSRAQAA